VTDLKPFVFRFGEFEVREREFLLFRAGRAVPVEPKAYRVLLFLLQNHGRLVKKDEILNAVWDDCSVSDNSLTRSIATLRRLLGDDSREPHYIATVQSKTGDRQDDTYRFALIGDRPVCHLFSTTPRVCKSS